jgi:micrococcal nuclease
MRFILAALLALVPAFGADAFTARVVKVADGDTLTVEAPGQTIRVRLFGIDAPEKNQDDGDAARAFVLDAAMGRTVQVVQHDTDRYGRMVADIVFPDGSVLNREVVKAGHAWWYSQYAPGAVDLKALEADARAHHRGLWAESNPLPPWEWRKTGRAVAQAAPRRSARRSERRDHR